LLRHTIPSGDPAEILERALAVLVDQLERRKTAKSTATRAAARQAQARRPSRHIPAHVKRAVWTRDEGRCAFVGPHGRCHERAQLEYHHVVPFALGGSTDVANLALRCRAHNGFESELIFGPWSPPDETRQLGPDRAELLIHCGG
jgi:5-methylcytosine-specific restriction endonuclease McrA